MGQGLRRWPSTPPREKALGPAQGWGSGKGESRLGDASSTGGVFVSCYPSAWHTVGTDCVIVEPTNGKRVPRHLGPSGRLGLSVHPVQLLQALAQDVLDVFYQLLYLQGRGQESRVNPGGLSSEPPAPGVRCSP